jgi:hypothetical protein
MVEFRRNDKQQQNQTNRAESKCAKFRITGWIIYESTHKPANQPIGFRSPEY